MSPPLWFGLGFLVGGVGVPVWLYLMMLTDERADLVRRMEADD